MRKFLAIAALGLPLMATPIVQYTTTGTFMPGGGSNVNIGAGTLSYISGGGTYDLGAINPSNVTLGSLNTLGFPSVTSLAGYTFTLTINQTSPEVASGSFTGTLTGHVVVNASNAYLMFNDTTLVLGTITYEIFQGPNGIAIVPPTANSGGTVTGGTTTIQGQISSPIGPTNTPEPATVGLMGLGLVSVGLLGRRYRSQ